jgi:hydroxypyruvate isomerase
MTLRFEPNLSILWPDRPLPERFARAADAGFGAVELWWAGDEDARLLPGLIARCPSTSTGRATAATSG